MARRRNSGKGKTRYVTKAKNVYRSTKSKAKGLGGAVAGAIAGALTPAANKYLGQWGQPAAMLGVGLYMKNDTLETLGGYSIGVKLGSSLANALPGGTTETSNGGYY